MVTINLIKPKNYRIVWKYYQNNCAECVVNYSLQLEKLVKNVILNSILGGLLIIET
jgi:hypothetical protein